MYTVSANKIGMVITQMDNTLFDQFVKMTKTVKCFSNRQFTEYTNPETLIK